MDRVKRTACILYAVLLLLLLPGQVLAAEAIDPNKDVTLTVKNTCADLAIPGARFDIYLVSVFDDKGAMTPAAQFRSYAAELDIKGENDNAWIALAAKLERDIVLGELENVQPTDSAVTDEKGNAQFPTKGTELSQGLYLVLGTSVELDGYVYGTVPFFVMLPSEDVTGTAWNYEVSLNPKPQKSPVLDDYTVIKVWDDASNAAARPKTIEIQLMCDGKPYGQSITLPQNGKWEYTWQDLNVNHRWTVTESPVDGYYDPEITQEGNVFKVVNVCKKPPQPDDPSLPQTGQLWWPVPLLLSAGLLFIVVGLIRRRGAAYEA